MPPPLFASERERRLWFWVAAVTIGIYSTLGLASSLAGALRDRGLLTAAFVLGMLLVGAAIVTQGLRTRPRGAEIGLALGVFGVYFMFFLRMALPEERSHLIEYSVVALLIYEALMERKSRGRSVPVPALLTVVGTGLLGWVDEGIQALLPNRVYDIQDVGFNALAGLLTVGASVALACLRRHFPKKTK